MMAERFSYPDNTCLGATALHRCVLPNGHTTKHLCGECGMMFDDTFTTKTEKVKNE